MAVDNFKISPVFEDHEVLLRAVWPPEKRPSLWTNEFVISPLALKDERGLSVNRSNNHDIRDVILHMKNKRLHGKVVSIGVPACREAEAVIRYLPSEEDSLHSEIHGSAESKQLSKEQCVLLADKAVLCGIIDD